MERTVSILYDIQHWEGVSSAERNVREFQEETGVQINVDYF